MNPAFEGDIIEAGYRPIVIKFLKDGFDDPAARERFAREARTAGRPDDRVTRQIERPHTAMGDESLYVIPPDDIGLPRQLDRTSLSVPSILPTPAGSRLKIRLPGTGPVRRCATRDT